MKTNKIDRDYIIHDNNTIKGFFGEYKWLSNFHICDVFFDDELYNSSEAAYMAGKTTDINIRKQLIKSTGITPVDAKKLGRSISLREGWDDIKFDHMYCVVFDKFNRNKYLRDKLLETGDRYLEETNHWNDCYWGICNGVGENKLGVILMKVREVLR